MQLAEPLLIARNKVRFRSLVNLRIFGLVLIRGCFFLVELDRDAEDALIKDLLYQGRNADEVKTVILKEVCDVR
jgi:hypothetical protein